MIRLSKNREGDELILQIDDRLSEAVMEFLSCMAGIMVEKQIYKYIEVSSKSCAAALPYLPSHLHSCRSCS